MCMLSNYTEKEFGLVGAIFCVIFFLLVIILPITIPTCMKKTLTNEIPSQTFDVPEQYFKKDK